jgi:hypothetical protein
LARIGADPALFAWMLTGEFLVEKSSMAYYKYGKCMMTFFSSEIWMLREIEDYAPGSGMNWTG